MSSSQESGHEYPFIFFSFKNTLSKKTYFKAKLRENQRSSEVLTINLHLNSFFQFLRSTSRCAHVSMFIVETNRIHGQRGIGPLISHLPIQRTVYLSSPRERWGLTARCTASQWNDITNLSNNSVFREDLHFKSLSCEDKKEKSKLCLVFYSLCSVLV